MVNVLLSIGANMECERQMQRAKERLTLAFPDITFTPTLSSPAYGMEPSAPPYTNMLAKFQTDKDEQQLILQLKSLEKELGDTPELRREGTVMMDLDILRFDRRRRHHDDWHRPYVRQLLDKLLMLFLAFTLSMSTSHSREQASVLLGKAIEYYQGRKYHECVLTFEKLRKHYRLNPRFTAYLGFSYYKEQQYEEAAECLKEGIPSLSVYSPKEQAVYLYACAESLFQLGKYDEALKYYEEALPLTDGFDSADVHFHAGFCYINQVALDSLAERRKDSLALVHLSTANTLYKETSKRAYLDELHTARLAQTSAMLRAMEKKFEPKDTVSLLTDSLLTDSLQVDSLQTDSLLADSLQAANNNTK